MKILSLLFGTLFMCFLSHLAHAAITCTTPSSTGFSTAYATGGIFPNVTQATVSFTCTRGTAADATTIFVRANNGTHRQGQQNRAQLNGANRINYEFYKEASCSTIWSNGNFDTIPITLSPVLTPQPITVNYWGCILTEPSVAAGTFTDSVRIRVRAVDSGGGGANNLSPNGNAAVSIVNQATCNITSVGNVAFGTYQSFRATPLIANTNIVMNCTTDLPYTMTLNANGGVISGLNYALTINAITPPVTTVGAGVGQSHTLTGTMPANQAGTCATGTCPGSQVHTLTITY